MGGCVSTAARRIRNEDKSIANINNTKLIATPNCLWLSGWTTMGFVVWCVLVVELQSPSPGSSDDLTAELIPVITQASGNHVERFDAPVHVRNLNSLGRIVGQLLVAQKIVS